MRPARLVAAAVIAALAGGAAYAIGRDGASVPIPVGSDTGPVPVGSDTGPTSTATSHIRAVTRSTAVPDRRLRSTVPPSSPDPRTVLSDGLEAWGRFAVTGDLDTLAPWFSSDGPQWERFESEAPGLSADPLGDPPYRVTVEAGDLKGDAEEMTVDGRVTFVRTGEPSQTFRWRIVLRNEIDGWRIWTVEEAGPYPSSSSIENP